MVRIFTAATAVFAAAIIFAPTSTAGQKQKRTFLDGKAAGPDFIVQGEYLGIIGEKTKLGAQVIARGNGKFDAVLYAKGLPGAGWDGKTKVVMKGETKNGVTIFTGKNFKGHISGGVFTGSAEANVQFKLKKTARVSPTLNAKPPADAIVLFNGKDVAAWENAKLEDGGLLGVGGRTIRKFKDFTLHLEFRLPFMPFARGQGRGNSGMYLLDQYECQILDSFGLTGENNECGGVYKVAKPKVNMCLPPLTWQTFDVEFKAARFNKAGKKTAPAIVTIRHNGVVIHNKLKLKLTAGGHQNDEKPGRLFLQNHGNPVRFRNIWIIEK
ncbi:MAG: DUF1080 domain-containing protein [Planctomycetes bacterium]|nr:DUF1080 domain-containing protein [Planctomycetota bacterium]